MNTRKLIITLIIFIITLYITVILFGCDNRISNSKLKLYSDTNIVYLNDQQNIVSINAQYRSRSREMNNKRIYFKTNNGYIKKNNENEWIEPLKILYVNTDKYGQSKIQYINPTQNNDACIYAWTYEYNNNSTMIQSVLIDSLILHVLPR